MRMRIRTTLFVHLRRTSHGLKEAQIKHPAESRGEGSPQRTAQVRTFLIADVRGYTGYTQAFGDEAAATLATAFAAIAREGVEAHRGEVIELRGDEALAVFTSARQAVRAAAE